MKLSGPGKPLFVISLVLFFVISLVLFILALLGVLGVAIPVVGGFTLWLAVASWVFLAIGCLMTGMKWRSAVVELSRHRHF